MGRKRNAYVFWSFPSGSEVKASASNAGDPGSISGSGRSPGEGNGNPPQYSCLENPMDGEAWLATVHGVTKRVRHDLVTKQKNFPDRILKHRKFILNTIPKVTEPMVGRAKN